MVKDSPGRGSRSLIHGRFCQKMLLPAPVGPFFSISALQWSSRRHYHEYEQVAILLLPTSMVCDLDIIGHGFIQRVDGQGC